MKLTPTIISWKLNYRKIMEVVRALYCFWLFQLSPRSWPHPATRQQWPSPFPQAMSCRFNKFCVSIL